MLLEPFSLPSIPCHQIRVIQLAIMIHVSKKVGISHVIITYAHDYLVEGSASPVPDYSKSLGWPELF